MSFELELDDDENLEKTINQIDKISTQPKFNKNVKHEKKKKKNRKENTEEIPFEEQEFIEYCLMDFRGVEELQKFKNIKYLTLIQQNIRSFTVRNLINKFNKNKIRKFPLFLKLRN
jgi:hypothetical protein